MLRWIKKNRAPQYASKATVPPLVVDGNTITPGPSQQVLSLHGELYRRLRKEIDFPPEQMEPYFDQLILSLEQHIHALPSSQHGDHRKPGGLLGKCLRMSFIAQRIAHGMVVASDLPADARSTAERGWRYAAMLAGLVYPLGTLAELGAKGGRSGRLWSPEKGALVRWCERAGESSYQPYWRNAMRPHATPASMRLWMLAQLLTAERATFIARETDEYLDDLVGVLAGTLDRHALMHQVIERALSKAREMDLNDHREQVKGLPIEDRYDRLKMVVNLAVEQNRNAGEESVVRRTDSSLCAFWPRFANQLRVVAADQDILGFAESDCDNDLLLTWLTEAGIVELDSQGHVLRPMVAVAKAEGACADGIVFAGLGISLEGFARARLPVVASPAPQVSDDAEASRSAESGDLFDGVDDTDVSRSVGRDAVEEVDSHPSEADSADQSPAQPDVTDATLSTTANAGAKPWFPRLGQLGEVLQTAASNKDELGWWTDKGRALPWPDIARDTNMAPRELLGMLHDCGAAVKSSNKQLPLIHEVSREGKPTMVVMIASDYWGR